MAGQALEDPSADQPQVDSTTAVAARDSVEPEEWLRRQRHSAAHVLAQVMLQIFPDAKLAIGPPIDTGFYYDFLLPRPLTPEDLKDLEKRMKKEAKRGHKFVWEEVQGAAARDRFAEQPFKLELIDQFTEDSATVGTCTHADFTDLCRGGHVQHTKQLGYFKLMSSAGAYWRGDENKPQLQRVYGALFSAKDELTAHLERLEEAARRDHRRLSRELGLFAFSEDIGAGIPLFLPKGEIIRHEIESYTREVQTRKGFEHVWTGHIAKRQLYEKSGHIDNYDSDMFPPMIDGDNAYFLKPMNCPSHMTLFKAELHSYRELPIRYSEFATLYRYERSGVLSGLTRVRSLTQDDCHIFCMEEQITSEFLLCLEIVQEEMATFGLDLRVALSLPGGEGKYVAAPEKWDAAVEALRTAMKASGLEYTEEEGEAAFYGPKADFFALDALGREWQLSTIQIDLIQPERIGCEYIGEDGAKHTPVVLHRAVVGSTERFMGVLIEHWAGNFPAWLAPVQARLVPIADRHLDYAKKVEAQAKALGLRVDVDAGGERMQAKIRNGQLQKIPYLLVVGDAEEEANSVAVRKRGGEDLGVQEVERFLTGLSQEVQERMREP